MCICGLQNDLNSFWQRLGKVLETFLKVRIDSIASHSWCRYVSCTSDQTLLVHPIPKVLWIEIW